MEYPLKVGTGYEQNDPGVYIFDADGHVVVADDVPLTHEMARLFVACVNALQDQSVDDLEYAVSVGIKDVSTGNWFSSRVRLTRQLRELQEKYDQLLRERME